MSDAQAAADAIARVRDGLARVTTQVGRVVVGMQGVVDQLLIALLADGHVLLEGPPGLGKTLLVRTLASTLSLEFRRLQCTPDLMPSDVVGSVVLTPAEGGPRFTFSRGPVFTNVLLVDEVNRATPKTQAALLEAMEERRVTAGGETRDLPLPFVVLATQNPIEMEGTYPLPEAQLDRFLLKVLVEPPAEDELVEIVRRTTGAPQEEPEPVVDADDLAEARSVVRQVALPPALLEKLARIVSATHPAHASAPDEVRRLVRYGASPRGARAVALAAKARALLAGRPNVALDDLRAVARPALRHRLILSFEAEAEGADADRVLDAVLQPLL